jgi:radial spoke head protein 4A
MPDILEEARMFEWGGIGFGHDETFRVMLSVKQLLEVTSFLLLLTVYKTHPLKSVRLFGKIFGRNNDYLICETEYKEGEREPEQVPEVVHKEDEDEEEEEDKVINKKDLVLEVPEEVGIGSNKFVYWVCTSGELMPSVK